eukprot:TRINITY_DN4005_c5_g1_i1.p1 TRINITY_DN4005_c5_g1~~TRINITY_DN4005_c5_g1_i1.p1  ORF type:complete len:135 (+),score=29.99 TRINITY_DN4005_c5_g1_i1:401-805(+)
MFSFIYLIFSIKEMSHIQFYLYLSNDELLKMLSHHYDSEEEMTTSKKNLVVESSVELHVQYYLEDEEDPMKHILGVLKTLMTKATRQYWISLRACYLTFPCFGWLIGPVWAFVGSLFTVVILYFTDATGKYHMI